MKKRIYDFASIKQLCVSGISLCCAITGAQAATASDTEYASDNAPVSQITQQNTKKISGIVKDPAGEPIIGANVIVKGTTNGVITGLDGDFNLEVPQNAVLEISYIGYMTQ